MLFHFPLETELGRFVVETFSLSRVGNPGDHQRRVVLQVDLLTLRTAMPIFVPQQVLRLPSAWCAFVVSVARPPRYKCAAGLQPVRPGNAQLGACQGLWVYQTHGQAVARSLATSPRA